MKVEEKVVICLKIRTFAVATTTPMFMDHFRQCCDLLENSYLCGSNNNARQKYSL